MQKVPYIALNENGVPTLYVKEKPFLMLAGELHNSAFSSLEFMEKEVWPYRDPLGLNTVIFPIAWENIEKAQGKFDFSLYAAFESAPFVHLPVFCRSLSAG